MSRLIKTNEEYKEWILQLKVRIKQSQIKAAIKVNRELIRMYWEMGKDIVSRQMDAVWGSGFYTNLSQDLSTEFPEMKGFSITNLKYCKKFYLFYNQEDINRPQLVDDLETTVFSIPWGHNRFLMDRCKSLDEAIFYIRKTIEHGWSRNLLMNYVETKLYEAQGKAVTNFSSSLPDSQSDLAQQMLKDPYNFDFLTLANGYAERELEEALTENITKFLLELGSGFAYVGRQCRIEVSGKEFFIDLLFYNLKLRCYVVIELKTGEFMPEYIGKLGFYISAVNHQLCHPADNPTIGLIICKTKDEIIARYTLENSSAPIGISEYQLAELLPKDFKCTLPTIREIEEELKNE